MMARLFGTDGIRGTVGEWPLIPEFLLRLGQAAGRRLRKEDERAMVVIGRDTRQSGAMLQQALSAGFLASGIDVIDLGILPTPGVACLARILNATAGVVISASHNPMEQNGIKFFSPAGQKLPVDLEQRIEDLVGSTPEALQSRFSVHTAVGRYQDGSTFQELYLQDLIGEHPYLNLSSLRIVVDCANGAASSLAPELFGRLGAQVIAVHASPTGTNINVRAGSEHVRRQVSDIGALIRQSEADFGLAFDGDADRVVFVDEKGSLIDGDHMIGMLANYFHNQNRLLGGAVVTTVMRNSGLKNRLEQSGIEMFETPVGDKYVTEKLMALRAENGYSGMSVGVGGEQSGHIIILDNAHLTGDGLRTALYVMRVFLETGARSMADFAESIGKTPQIIASAFVGQGQRIDKEELKRVEAQFLSSQPGLVRLNLRYSGTEPLFRVMLESDGSLNEEELAQIAVALCRHAQECSGAIGGEIDILNSTHGGLIVL
jgi:phosphoglucosamine mutase